MRFHADSVSASADGDYYQLSFGPLDRGDVEGGCCYDLAGPYLVVQRQFEMPDQGRCYVEMDNEGYVGHFHLRLVELGPTSIVIDIERATNRHVEVTFSLTATEFDEFRRSAEIVFGLRDPCSDEDEAP